VTGVTGPLGTPSAAPLRLAISPCPNDTFLAHALVQGRVRAPQPFTVSYDDIDVLNTRAAASEPDVVKVSVAALPELLGTYDLLDAGAALGRGCGPLVVARSADVDLASVRVAIPGERTTALLLLRLWRPGTNIVVMPFDQIMPAVQRGEVGAGLIIHESRFTYPKHGLTQVVDLGDWWEAQTGLPIPLGCFVARKGLDVDAWSAALRASVEDAWSAPQDAALQDYISSFAQEMDPAVQQQHIALYVNGFTRHLGKEGRAAIDALLARA
jgi:1,4-dihydroxy-6-naphthoate synthase